MKIKLDTGADALYIKIKKGRVHKTIDRGDSLLDLNKKGEVIGIEVLNYSKAVPEKSERSSIFINQKKFALPIS